MCCGSFDDFVYVILLEDDDDVKLLVEGISGAVSIESLGTWALPSSFVFSGLQNCGMLKYYKWIESELFDFNLTVQFDLTNVFDTYHWFLCIV